MSDLMRLLHEDELDVASLSVEEIRAKRTEYTGLETSLSYFRRMVQGRLDIVGREQQRRRDGGPTSDIHALIGELPEIFSEQRRPGGTGRLPTTLDAPDVPAELVSRLEVIAGPSHLATVAELSDADLGVLADELAELERTVSDQRRLMFDRIDALQAELTERYRTGQASVDSLLAES